MKFEVFFACRKVAWAPRQRQWPAQFLAQAFCG